MRKLNFTLILLAAALIWTGLAPAASASNHYWQTGSGTGSRHYWQTGTNAGSQYYWQTGTGIGSQHYWQTGTGPGSQHYWQTGTDAGSRHYWQTGTGPGSQYYWQAGTGAGSQHYWQTGAGASVIPEYPDGVKYAMLQRLGVSAQSSAPESKLLRSATFKRVNAAMLPVIRAWGAAQKLAVPTQ
ncbi:MAG: hypothetical protein ABIJ96_14590 [Elusimicrobiota bacterium]